MASQVATPEQKRRMREYRRQGYTMCVWHIRGFACPGYHDSILRHALDHLDLQREIEEFLDAARLE